MDTITILGQELLIDHIDFDMIACQHVVYSSFHVSGSGDSELIGNSAKVKTYYGEIEKPEWMRLIRTLIEALHDADRYNEIHSRIGSVPVLTFDVDVEFAALQRYVSEKAYEQKKRYGHAAV